MWNNVMRKMEKKFHLSNLSSLLNDTMSFEEKKLNSSPTPALPQTQTLKLPKM